MSSGLIEISPAIFGFVTVGLFSLYYLGGGREFFTIISKRFPPLVLYSFVFIVSGFLAQRFYQPVIEFFISSDKKVSDQSKLIVTIISGFVVNSIFRYLSNQKEKKETATLFCNNINSQVISLAAINQWLILKNLDQIDGYVEICKTRLVSNQYHKDSFNKIGIYNHQEIELISRYSSSLDRCLNSIERLLLDFRAKKEGSANQGSSLKRDTLIWVFPSENGCKTYPVGQKLKAFRDKLSRLKLIPANQTPYRQKFKYEPSNFVFVTLKIDLIISILLGYVLVYTLEIHSKSQNNEKNLSEFVEDYKKAINSLKQMFDCSHFYILDNCIANDLVENLKYIRFQYNLVNSTSIDETEIYICRLSNKTIIREVSNQDILLQIISFIDNSESIVSFGESEQKAINNSKQKLKQHLLNHKYDENQAEDIIQSCKTVTEIISPWGGNISLWNQVAILKSKR